MMPSSNLARLSTSLILSSAVAATTLAGCGGQPESEPQDQKAETPYCYLAVDAQTCTCTTKPDTNLGRAISVPTCAGVRTWTVCCRWPGDCACYEGGDAGGLTVTTEGCVGLSTDPFLKGALVDSCPAGVEPPALIRATDGRCAPNAEPGTDNAACRSDQDCLSGFCADTVNGPRCYPAGDEELASGRGLECATDEDCQLVATDLLVRFGKAACVRPQGQVHRVCSFTCDVR